MSQPSNFVPLKVGFFGEQGTGKSTTAALLAAGLSKEMHDGADVFVTDPELGWQFLNPRIFRPEKIRLVQRTVPTFKAMVSDMHEAERNGCVWAVELAKVYIELVRTLQAKCGDRWGMELSTMWTDFVNEFLNSRVHCLALSRVADLTEEVLNEQGRMQRIKIAEGMKAGGQRNNFAYEPHLVLRMTLEKKPRKKNGEEIEGEGKLVHRVDVLKDRTWTLNGKTFRWVDRQSYKPGGYAQVWTSLLPHFREMQASAAPKIDTLATSESLVTYDGNSEFWERKKRCEAQLAEVQASFDLMWGGQGATEKRIRLIVAERIFGVRSKEAREQLELDQVERGLKVLRAIEDRITSGVDVMPTTEAGILRLVDLSIDDIDSPGAKKSINQVLLEDSLRQRGIAV